MSALDNVLAANEEYSGSFDKGDLAIPPARGIAVLTCMDARLDPAQFAGLGLGDAHVIRNAGGRASDDAIRSLVISYKLLGTQEWFVIHHTDCGMEFFTNELMGDLLERSLETAELGEGGFRDVGSWISVSTYSVIPSPSIVSQSVASSGGWVATCFSPLSWIQT